MVAIIKTGYAIHKVFYYNENKVKENEAECIGAGNYPIDADKMGLTVKLNRFLKQLELNENVKRNSVHISINFDPSENHSKEKLMAIADTYMEKIGFGQQPYLVYQHHDSGHPHIHLVTINVQRDGTRIDMQNIGKNRSEPARKEIEERFGLVKAQGNKNSPDFTLKPIISQKIQYGRSESKKAITNVLGQVLSLYKYASFPELNAVLKQYNVLADRGNEDSKMFKAKGLMYRILDENGKPIGVPIKASLFHNKPTLKFLEEKFAFNKTNDVSDIRRVKNAIDMAFLRTEISLNQLVLLLEKEGINTVFRKNTEGLIYGITYVDHTTKCVFNGSTLGKQYSAKAIQERCASINPAEQKMTISVIEKSYEITFEASKSEIIAALFGDDFRDNKYIGSSTVMGQLAEMLTQSEQTAVYLPYELRNKKKKRKGQSNNR
ncbi:relaxase/mobilization nuclease domain-containing protein [Flavobacterium sp. Fl-318]|uniref:Relaxase/mobilization nuclease domain-containing protein n=1 Tax=Flavobacterium cupriresistens TaxID=2893885 RepID=A0ABU4RHP2_9FLAO|nr:MULTISPECIES: relaxase/mobilization nuclease domain-containing protein [unclassified Flavobacterium]MDX6192082.1 relaxase/mobilization nuclease domain-containing protein [Flavobacterium sp. Fl-318]UFH44663.1 relaxase/mobilization nuclease domain-containing protein [Flavobacterium sp. F-323]